jgi:hypothetical protein
VTNPKTIGRLAKRGAADGTGSRGARTGAGRSTEWVERNLTLAREQFDLAVAGLRDALAAAVEAKDDAALVRIANFFRTLELDLLFLDAEGGRNAERGRTVDAFVRKPLTGGDQGSGGVPVDGDQPQDHEQAR